MVSHHGGGEKGRITWNVTDKLTIGLTDRALFNLRYLTKEEDGKVMLSWYEAKKLV